MNDPQPDPSPYAYGEGLLVLGAEEENAGEGAELPEHRKVLQRQFALLAQTWANRVERCRRLRSSFARSDPASQPF